MIFLFIGTTELLLVGGMVLLLFGGKKLPEMMQGLGKGVKAFKNGMKESESTNTQAKDSEENEECQVLEKQPNE